MLRAPTILVVDDNQHMRRLLLELLHCAFPGSSVQEAATARDARAHCRQTQPQMVVMDVGLPDGDGIQLTRHVRQLYPATVVVVVSSHEGAAYRNAARDAGAAAYVAKNEVFTALVPAITAALHRHIQEPPA